MDIKGPRTREAMSCAALTGLKVLNKDGEDLGKIEGFMVNLRTGHISYAALSFGGVLGIGERYFGIPWDALTLDQERMVYILDLPKQKLRGVSGFNKDQWPENSEAQWKAIKGEA